MRVSRTVDLSSAPHAIGRNDPCFCGSGKKYKKCHFLTEPKEPVFVQDRAGWTSPFLDWVTMQPWYFPLFEKTLRSIFGHPKEMSEEEVQALNETILFEGKAKNGKTPLELYITEGNLSSTKKAVYQKWLEQQEFGAWKVQEVFTGKGVIVKEWMGDKTFTVSEHMGSFSVKPGDVLMNRILPIGNGWMFGGGVSAKFPESWVYESKKRDMPFTMSSLEFMQLWYGKQPLKEKQTRSYEQLKNELADFIVQQELPFTLENFDKRLQEAENPTVLFYPMLICLVENKTLMEQANDLAIALWEAGREKKDFDEEKITGSVEDALVKDFADYCAARYQEEDIVHPQEQIHICKVWREAWLKTPQKALDNKTPWQAIREERQKAGNNSTVFSVASTLIFWSKKWQAASELHFKALRAFKRKYFEKSREHLTRLIEMYPEFPFIYRSLANLGMTYIAMGDKEEGMRFLEQSREKNPNYKFAQERIQAITKISTKKIAEMAKAQAEAVTAKKVLKMIEKAQQRKPGRRRQWVKK